MNKQKESILNMYDALITFCNNNADTVATVPAFETAFTAFETTVGEIHDTVQMQVSIISGITDAKNLLRKSLCEQAADLCAIIFAFASSTNDVELKAQGNFSISDFKRLSDEMLVPACSNIYNTVNDNIKSLKTYGVTADALTDFQTAIDDYKEKLSSPRNAVTQRAAHSTALNNLFVQANDILKSQMDKVAFQFKATAEGFYVAYKNNRNIVSPGTSATQITGTITNSVTHVPLPGATVQVVGQPLKTVTNENGFFVLKSVSPGNRSIKVAIAGYGDKQQDGLVVKPGKTTSANIAITPNAS